GGQERVLLVAELGVRLSEHENRILRVPGGRMKEVGATSVLQRIERLRRVADRSKGEGVPEPPRVVGKPATEGPRLLPRVIHVEPLEVERARMELDRCIAEEWRELLHAFGEPRNDAPQLRHGGLGGGLRGENTFGRRPLRIQDMQMPHQNLVVRECRRWCRSRLRRRRGGCRLRLRRGGPCDDKRYDSRGDDSVFRHGPSSRPRLLVQGYGRRSRVNWTKVLTS